MGPAGLTERLLHRERLLILALIGVLFLGAGLYTIAGVGMNRGAVEMTAMSGMDGMDGMQADAAAGGWTLPRAGLVFLMWWVMMVAMMLPGASPTILLYAALRRGTAGPERAAAAATVFLAGYLVAWAGFGAAATAAHWSLEAAGLVSPTMMSLTGTVPGALVLIAAGIVQFTPLKRACLSRCRAPAEVIARRRRGTGGAFAMGIGHGADCLGCCWALMALLFVGGVMNLYWIAGLTAFVALEKLSPAGAALGRIGGLGLIAWGALVLSQML